MKAFKFLAVILALSFMFYSCEDESAGDKIKDAGEEIEDGVEELGQNIEKGAEDATTTLAYNIDQAINEIDAKLDEMGEATDKAAVKTEGKLREMRTELVQRKNSIDAWAGRTSDELKADWNDFERITESKIEDVESELNRI